MNTQMFLYAGATDPATGLQELQWQPVVFGNIVNGGHATPDGILVAAFDDTGRRWPVWSVLPE